MKSKEMLVFAIGVGAMVMAIVQFADNDMKRN